MTNDHGKKLVFYLLIALMILFQPLQGTGLAGRLSDDTVPEQVSEPETAQKDAPLSLHSPDIIAQPVLPQPVGGPDLFGYTWQTSGPYNWKDASTDSGMDTDDGYVGPINLGFNFKYYENSYNQLYISSNGLVTFGKGSSDFNNRTIPFPAQPQNFIAPFWDDLVVKKDQGGKVYFQQMADAGGKYFVAEWKNVARRASSADLLTFEVILRENGNICFQYQGLNGVLDSATVGIEDPDGVDGLLYLRNADGLQSLAGTHSLCFLRPAPALRMKVLPYYQGSFTLAGKATFDVTIKNISDVASPSVDTYELSYTPSTTGWSVLLYNRDESEFLVDSNGNGSKDTGPLEIGASFVIKVKLIAPLTRQVGDYNRVTLKVASKSNPALSRSVVLHAAIPATFAQSLVDKQKGIDYRLYWDVNQRNTLATNIFTGSNLSFIGLPSGGFMYVWEKNEAKSVGAFDVPYTNLEYILIDRYGRISKLQAKLTDNSQNTTATRQINDRSPALAVNSSGVVGVAWVREVISSTVINSNVYFVPIDTKKPSAPVPAPINVTGNKSWRGAGSENVPLYRSPRSAVSMDNRFFFAFTDSRQQPAGEENNIKLAIYTLAGQPVKQPFNMTSSTPGAVAFQDPALFTLNAGRVFLAYSRQDMNQKTYQIFYVPLDSNGASIKPAAAPSGALGWLPTGLQFAKGSILLSWTQTTRNQIAFVIIDSSSFAVIHGPTDLTTPDGRSGDAVSVVKNKNGDAVLSWIDAELNHQLYYALVDPSGTVVTLPIVFFQVESPSAITVNDGGYALAPYDGNALIGIPYVIRSK